MLLTPIYISPPHNQGRKHQNQPRQEEKKRVEQEKNTQTREKNRRFAANNPDQLKIQRLNRITAHKKTLYAIVRDLSSVFKAN